MFGYGANDALKTMTYQSATITKYSHTPHTHSKQTSIKQHTRIKFANRLQKNPGDPPEMVNRAKYKLRICS